MNRSIDEIQSDFDSLTPLDFNEWAESSCGWQRLDELCSELGDHSDVDAVARLLLEFLERLDQSDLGSPGPAVHLLEKLPGYREHLKQSLLRRPTQLTVWMVNRILNTSPPDRDEWLHLLRAASGNSNLPHATREGAREFLAFQEDR